MQLQLPQNLLERQLRLHLLQPRSQHFSRATLHTLPRGIRSLQVPATLHSLQLPHVATQRRTVSRRTRGSSADIPSLPSSVAAVRPNN